jgi:hypothetical protein
MKERNTVKSLFSREQMNDYSGCLFIGYKTVVT